MFNIRFSNIQRGNYFLTLINHKGQVIWNKSIYNTVGNTSQIFPVNFHFPAGKYKLQIAGENKTFVKHLIKLRLGK